MSGQGWVVEGLVARARPGLGSGGLVARSRPGLGSGGEVALVRQAGTRMWPQHVVH